MEVKPLDLIPSRPGRSDPCHRRPRVLHPGPLERLPRGRLVKPVGLPNPLPTLRGHGMDVALIPKDNVPELVDVPAEVVRELKIMPMNHIRDVLKIALNRDVVKGK